MKIHVEMDETEMQDFLQYRKEKKNRIREKDRLDDISKKVLWAIGPDKENKGKFAVIDQDHAEDLMEMAAMYAK